MTSDEAQLYKHLVTEFSSITGHFPHPETGLCCADVDEHGAPKCCYQLVQGEQLTFTPLEVKVLREIHGRQLQFHELPDGRIVHRDDLLKVEEHRELLKDGWMAETLECVSHPLRPVISAEGWVTGVMAVPDCNTERALEGYKLDRDYLIHLWQAAVNMFGYKPYYVTETPKKEWILI